MTTAAWEASQLVWKCIGPSTALDHFQANDPTSLRMTGMTRDYAVCHAAAVLILGLLSAVASVSADDSQNQRVVPACSSERIQGRRIHSGELRYVVPKSAKVKHIKDIDYREYRVVLNHQEKWEALLLFSGNGTPYSICSAAHHQGLELPDGRKGVDARCNSSANGDVIQSRSTGFENDYAYYDSVSPESAKYFDAIIDSMCYEHTRR